MNDYIILDSKRYSAVHGSFKLISERPMMVRRMLSGTVVVKFGPAVYKSWRGILNVPVSANAPYGTISDFRTTYAKLQSLSFTDHYNVSHTVVMDRNIPEESLSPAWDGTSNVFKIDVNIIKVA